MSSCIMYLMFEYILAYLHLGRRMIHYFDKDKKITLVIIQVWIQIVTTDALAPLQRSSTYMHLFAPVCVCGAREVDAESSDGLNSLMIPCHSKWRSVG